MNKKALGTIVILMGIIVAGYLLGQQNRSASGQVLKLGSILILSGDGASWGEAARNGIAMAVEEINKADGINGKQIKVITEDDKADPKLALSAFRKLTESDGVKFIVGTSWSLTGLPLVKPADENKIVMISPSLGLKEFNEGSKYLFNTYPHDNILSGYLADLVYKDGRRKVALFGAQDPWVKDQTKTFKDKFESLGGKITFLTEPLTSSKDVRTDVAKLKSNPGIDAVVMTTNGYSLTALNAQAMERFGIKLPIYSISTDKKILADCGKACDGMIMLSFLTPTPEFASKYKTKFNREVEIGADSAYDAVMLLVQAFKATKSESPEIVQAYLNNIKSYHGASGSLIADGKGGFVKAYVTDIIQNSVPVLVK